MIKNSLTVAGTTKYFVIKMRYQSEKTVISLRCLCHVAESFARDQIVCTVCLDLG